MKSIAQHLNESAKKRRKYPDTPEGLDNFLREKVDEEMQDIDPEDLENGNFDGFSIQQYILSLAEENFPKSFKEAGEDTIADTIDEYVSQW